MLSIFASSKLIGIEGSLEEAKEGSHDGKGAFRILEAVSVKLQDLANASC